MSEWRFSEEVDTAIVKLTVDICATLNLKNWEVGLNIAAPPQDSYDDKDQQAFAEVRPIPHRHYATLFVCDDFLKVGHRDMFYVLVHEVCHLYMVGLKQGVEDQMNINSMSVSEYNQFIVRMHHEEEMAVDLMATAFADILFDEPAVQSGLKKITKQAERSAP